MSQKYTITGTVVEIFPTQSFGAKGFQKREFRLREKSDSQWPNIVPLILTKDKCALADSIDEGAEVTAHFSLSGRIWDKGDGSPTRCFCENQCWKIDILSKAPQKVPSPATPPEDMAVDNYEEDPTDIPF